MLKSGVLYTKFSCKKIILTSLCAVLFGLLLFPISGDNKFLLGLARLISGFFQIFLIIYFPVWVDTFGGDRKTQWLSFVQLAVVLGVVVGYIITAFFNISQIKYHIFSWRYSFYLQFLILCGVTVFFYYCDEDILATNGIVTQVAEQKQDNFANYPVLRTSFRATPSVVFNKSFDLDMDEISDINFNPSHDEKQKKNDKNTEQPAPESFKEQIKLIIKKRLFILSMLTQCALYFIITAIQFWISDYMITILNISKSEVFILFVIISTTAPSLGLIIGGKLSEKLGGYQGPNAIKFCLINSIIASLFSIPIPFMQTKIYVIMCFWFMLFFGASMLPTLVGLMISSVPKNIRNLGNAFAQFMFNLLGYCPSPVLYGYVNSLDKSIVQKRKTKSLGNDFGCFLVALGCCFFTLCFFQVATEKGFNIIKRNIESQNKKLQQHIAC